MSLDVPPDVQRTRAHAEEPHLRFYPWGEHCIAEVRCRWADELDPFAVMNAFPNDWKTYWRSKTEPGFALGLSALAVTREPGRASEGLRFYGGLPFDEPGLSDEWGFLEHGAFFLPRFEWREEDGVLWLYQRHVTPRHVDSERVLNDFMMARQLLVAQLSLTPSTSDEPVHVRAERVDQTEAEWCAIVERARDTIRAGALSKVVLARSRTLELSRAPGAGSLLRSLDHLREASYLFAVQAPDGTAFVGRSPERLVSWRDAALEADAIAGTRRRSADGVVDRSDADALQASPKEQQEHRLVVEDIEARLKAVCSQLSTEEAPVLLKLHNVQHMLTRFKGSLRSSASPWDVVRSLHPTPAVGGVPRDAALAFLRAEENWCRGWYAGPVGWTDGRSGDFAIGIRTALLKGSQLKVFAGAGIMADSEPEAEWFETEAKMKNFLDLFPAEHP